MLKLNRSEPEAKPGAITFPRTGFFLKVLIFIPVILDEASFYMKGKELSSMVSFGTQVSETGCAPGAGANKTSIVFFGAIRPAPVETRFVRPKTSDVTPKTSDVALETSYVTLETSDVTLKTSDVTPKTHHASYQTRYVNVQTRCAAPPPTIGPRTAKADCTMYNTIKSRRKTK